MVTARSFSIDVVQKLVDAGFTAYWAGGCVRDLLRGKVPHDYDVATNATPQQVRELFGNKKTLAVGESFGVIIVLGPRVDGPKEPPLQVEVATFRSEGEYSDGRRPDSVEFCTPEEDAHRRDFTINGMFYDPLTEVVRDFVGGQEDLNRRIVRAIGDAHDRIHEDKLRMLRAVRFASVLDFDLDHDTATAVRELADDVQVVSVERIAQELKTLLVDVHRARGMELLVQLDLLSRIFPEVCEKTLKSESQWRDLIEILRQLDVATFEVVMAVVLRDVPAGGPQKAKEVPQQGTQRAICRRLKLSNHETDAICWLGQHRGALRDAHSMSLAELKRLAVHPEFENLLQLERTATVVRGESIEPIEFVDDFLKRTPKEEIDPPELLTGRDLIKMGYRPGPDFKDWLIAVRDAQLNNEISSRDEAVQMIETLAQA